MSCYCAVPCSPTGCCAWSERWNPTPAGRLALAELEAEDAARTAALNDTAVKHDPVNHPSRYARKAQWYLQRMIQAREET